MRLFHTEPSRHLTNKALKSLGLQNLDDFQFIDPGQVNPEIMVEVIEEMRGLMFPCHVLTYIDRENFSVRHYLLLVKQLIRPYNRCFIRKEMALQLNKHDKTYKYTTYYALRPKVPETDSAVLNQQISFS